MRIERTLRHKWIVPVAALVLVLAIGSGAWAATSTTGSSASSDQTTTSDQATATGQAATPAPGCGPGGPFGFGGGGRMRGPAGESAQAQEFRAQAQQRRESMMKLAREEMSAADQAIFDQLVAQQQSQTEALRKAAEAVRSTNQQLRDLIDEYLSTGSNPSSDAAGTTATTVPAVSSPAL